MPAVLSWKHPSWPLPFIVGSPALYISNSYYITGDIAANQWRWYRITLPIPANATNIVPSGVTTVNSDNADRTRINGRVAGTDGEVEGAFVDNHDWAVPQTYPLQAPEDVPPAANQRSVPAEAEPSRTAAAADQSKAPAEVPARGCPCRHSLRPLNLSAFANFDYKIATCLK